MEKNISEKLLGVQKNALLKDYTTYKIGGPAKYFFVAKTKEDLMLALKVAKDLKLPVFILGGGSNLLVSEKGFSGLVIKINITDIDFREKNVLVGSGFNLNKLNYLFAEKSFSGLEWAAGLPGTVGGAIYGNAQAFGTKISDAIESVEAINIKTSEIKSFNKKQCQFSLKDSIFKKNKNLIIVSVILKFKKGDPQEIKNKITELVNYRKTRHPMDFPSAGSTFVNPETKIRNKKVLEKFPELKEYNKIGTIPSGYLIAKSGLAGKKIGNAQISQKHANFVLNLGGAKAKDVLALIKLAKVRVRKNFGIELEPEVQFVGFK